MTDKTGPKPKRPVLIIQHAQYEHPAALRRALQTQGIQSIWLHPYRGELYPSLASFHGVISLGGPMGANDDKDHGWIKDECDLLKRAFDANHPIAGICLGGQMLARAMGGRVEKHSTAEVGWFPIKLNKEGEKDRILGSAGSDPLVYQWHMDTFHLPKGATLLAKSPVCARQAYRLSDKVYGFQFHPEADHQLVHEWLGLKGVPEEISLEQDRYGTDTVQDAETQKDLAGKGERASVKIAAAIGQLFKNRDYAGVPDDVHRMLEAFATHRWEIAVELHSPDGRTVTLIGTIASLMTIPDGEFMILKDRDTVLWPIRLDYPKSITPVSR